MPIVKNLFPYKQMLRVLLIIFLIFIHLPSYTLADEIKTSIISEHLEYDINTNTYYLKGNVMIKREGASITADEIEFHEEEPFIKAKGNVIYNDSDVTINASNIELNLDKKTGKIENANFLFKKDNYRISGDSIIKSDENKYMIKKASFTTCDSEVPDWCFYANEMEAIVGNWIKAKGVTFRLKGLPTLYVPIFIAPFLMERKSGFLIPTIGYRSNKGAYLNQPFYWVISENRDATFNLNIYTKRGIGEGIEYRYVERGGIEGQWWVSHQNDRELDKDFFHIKGNHFHLSDNGFSTNIDAHYVNEKEYFKEYSPDVERRIQRYLESNADIAYSTDNTRLYFLAQYWIDLEKETGDISQRLPEIGFTIHPLGEKGISFSLISSATNFWSKSGVNGQRLDIFPKVYYKMGDSLRLTQTAGVRVSSYSLKNDTGNTEDPHSAPFEYTASIDTTLVKRYKSFLHVIEPALRYRLITEDNNAPLFDSVELFDRTSALDLSLMNYFMTEKGHFLLFRISNPYDFDESNDPLGPLSFEASILRPISFRTDISYDHDKSKLVEANSDFSLIISDIEFSIGERFNEVSDILFLTGGFGFNLLKEIRINASTWYDMKGEGLRNLDIGATYSSQCWGASILFNKRLDDYSIYFTIELKGLGKYKFTGV